MTMKKKLFRMAPLQRLTVKPIEDPAEQAALDARLKQSEEASATAREGSNASSRVTAAVVLELCRRLSAKARLTVANELSAQLSPEQRMEVIQRWLRQLPDKLRGQLAQGLLGLIEDACETRSRDTGPTRSPSGRG